MKKFIFLALIVICAVAIIHAFFMPWAKANVSVTKVAGGLVESADTTLKNTPFAGKFIKQLNVVTEAVSDLGDIEVKTQVSGYDIPALINKKSSKIAISLAQVMFKDVKDLDKKSMLVYLLPLMALVCAGLGIIGLKNNISVIVMVVISGAISIVGLYNLMTVKLDNLTVNISIEQGLWQTMYAYLLICVIGVIWVVTDMVGAKK